MISSAAFGNELEKIAIRRGSTLGRVGQRLGLLEDPIEAAAKRGMKTVREAYESTKPSAAIAKQLKTMKLKRQLAEMKRARGL